MKPTEDKFKKEKEKISEMFILFFKKMITK